MGKSKIKKSTKVKRGPTEADLLLPKHLTELGLKITSEYRFHPTRKWRFDFADLGYKVAFEIEGGIWNAGRHNRGVGFQADLEKYNTATSFGWAVFRFSTNDVLTGTAKAYVFDWLKLWFTTERK